MTDTDVLIDEPAPMSKRMRRFLAKPPHRLMPEAIAARRTKCVRRAKPKGWLEELCEIQRWQCHYCNRHMRRKANPKHPGREATLDHLLPVSRGGKNQRGNLVAACRSCNQAKGAMTMEEFLAHRAATNTNPGA